MKATQLAELAAIITLLLLAADIGFCSDGQVPERAKWVIMIYMAADNNLEGASVINMNQLERVGSSESIKVVVQWDRISGYDSSNGDWTGTKRFLISKDDDEKRVGSQELEDLGEVDMGDKNSLVDFIKWTRQNYPADRYALSLWNHGGGWVLHTYDDTSHTNLTLESLSDALEASGFEGEKKLDLLIFDECLMGLIDVANEITPYAKVMIASEDLVPYYGIDFSKPLSQLEDNPEMDERELARSIVASYQDFYTNEVPHPFVTLAAYDLEKMPDVINATALLSDVLCKRMDQVWPQIGTSFSFSEAFSRSEGLAQFKLYSNYYDLFDFADLLGLSKIDAEISDALDDLKRSIRSAIIAEYHGSAHPFAYGMAVYFPEDEELFRDYRDYYPVFSRFARDSGWAGLLNRYIAAEETDKIAPAIDIDYIGPQPCNITHPARIIGNATGNNIAYMSRIIGKLEGDELVMLNEHQVSRYYLDYTGSRKLPEFVDGRNNIDFTWAPVIDVLTNGEKSVIAPAYPYDMQDYYFTVDGKYQRKNETEPFSSRLIFNYMTGKMKSALRVDDILISEFLPQAGDIFVPESIALYEENDEIKVVELEGLIFGDCGIWLEPRPLDEGRYMIGLYLKDLSGNANITMRGIDVAGQPALRPPISPRDILGRWAGYGPYGDTQFFFEFSESKLSESKPSMMAEFPLCSIWRWGTLSIKAPGREEKVAQFVYRLRNNDGLTLMTLILLPKGRDSIYMAFLVSLEGDELKMYDVFESGVYSLKRSNMRSVLHEQLSSFETDFGQYVRTTRNLTSQISQ